MRRIELSLSLSNFGIPLLLFFGDEKREHLQGLPGPLLGRDGLLDAALGVDPGGGGGLLHRIGRDFGCGDKGLGRFLAEEDRRRVVDGAGATVAVEIEEGESGGIGLGAGRALEGGAIGAVVVSDGGAFDAHDSVTCRRGVVEVEDVEADRAEEAGVVLEDAVGAEPLEQTPETYVVEEPPLGGAAAAAEALIGFWKVSLHRHPTRI